ncbi:hypothetical protein Pelo_9309 [Pelomyxa schiedti]|nr:hypothetical protein Pelo_9309 [Pelomyxa schiedti]
MVMILSVKVCSYSGRPVKNIRVVAFSSYSAGKVVSKCRAMCRPESDEWYRPRLVFGTRHLDDAKPLGYYKSVKNGSHLSLECMKQGEMQLIIKGLSGESYAVFINSSASIEKLREVSCVGAGLDPHVADVRFIYRGVELERGRRVEDYYITADSTVHMVGRLCGGSCTTQSSTWQAIAPSVPSSKTPTGDTVFETVGTTISFFPIRTKGTNYVKLCTGLINYVPDLKDTLWQYTSGPGWLCSKLNLALASDSLEGLTEHCKLVRDLKYVIGKFGKSFEGVAHRGVNLIPKELEAYKQMGTKEFYIPSFTSASKTAPWNKNTVIHFHMHSGVGFAIVIKPEWTKFPGENEVLLSCYNVYKVLSIDTSSVPAVIHMEVLDYHKFHNDFANTHSSLQSKS